MKARRSVLIGLFMLAIAGPLSVTSLTIPQSVLLRADEVIE